jgi:hypothetical protein
MPSYGATDGVRGVWGSSAEAHVEITAGLQAGERYAAETFVLKADLGKGTGSHDH